MVHYNLGWNKGVEIKSIQLLLYLDHMILLLTRGCRIIRH